ncbi:MAG: hypothetical protein ABL993_16860, partial [Vicinamibacterales bacterium]
MRRARHPFVIALVAVAVGLAAFLYRFNTLGGSLAGFDNDHFLHLTRAEAVLNGELPLRDFTDAGLGALWPPLLYTTSALAQRALGPTLRSEALLTIGLLALGAIALCWVAATLAQRVLPAVLATLIAIGLGPALYNYPKIVPYAFAMVAMVVYARRPTTWRLLLLATTVVVAALFRHDHGVFLGISSGVLIVLLHRPRVRQPLMTFSAFVLLGLLPGVVFAEQHGGFIAYLRNCLEVTRQEAARTVAPPARFDIDWSQPWLVRADPPPPPRPRIGVRWAESVTPEARQRAEEGMGLSEPAAREGAQTWGYSIEDPSPRRLSAIVTDPQVADTDGIDRQAFTITADPAPAPGWLERTGLFRWRVAPGVLREANAAPWLYMMAWAVVVASLASLVVPPLRRAFDQPDVPFPVIAAVSVLGLLLVVAFLRNPAPQRLPDASAPLVILGSWLLAAVPRSMRSRPWPLRAMLNLLLAGAVGLTALSAGAIGTVPQQITGTGVTDGVDGMREQWREVWNGLGALPDTTSGIEAELGRTVGYIRRCSAPTDRLLVGDNLPEIAYFSERLFAAGRESFFSRFYSSVEAQQAAIERWSHQSVPIALMQPRERFDVEFASDYPLLAAYLRAHYRRTGKLEVRRGTWLDVWVERDRTASRDRETGQPC